MENKVYQYDIGTILKFQIESDISTAKYAKILVKKPINTAEWLDVNIDKTNNIITYIIKENDLDEVGKYTLQVYIELEDWKGTSDPVELNVHKKII